MPRMWMIEPRALCNRHLIAEHHECHVFFGRLRKGMNVEGWVINNYLEPLSLHARHEILVVEMEARGFGHRSPFPAMSLIQRLVDALPSHIRERRVDVELASADLRRRCPACAERMGEMGV